MGALDLADKLGLERLLTWIARPDIKKEWLDGKPMHIKSIILECKRNTQCSVLGCPVLGSYPNDYRVDKERRLRSPRRWVKRRGAPAGWWRMKHLA